MGRGRIFIFTLRRLLTQKDFVNISHDIFLYSSPGLADSNGIIILHGQMGTAFFYINRTKQGYNDYTHES